MPGEGRIDLQVAVIDGASAGVPDQLTKTGDTEARAALFEAAHVMLHRVKKWSGLKAWATKVAQRQGNKRATVALARKMAVVMHRMWVDGTTFRFSAADPSAAAAA